MTTRSVAATVIASATRDGDWAAASTPRLPAATTYVMPEAIDRLIAGLEKKRVMSQKEREIVAYHESGHAIVASLLQGMDPVHKISIVQRGFGALGYTMQLPLEDRYLMQRKDLLNQLARVGSRRAAAWLQESNSRRRRTRQARRARTDSSCRSRAAS